MYPSVVFEKIYKNVYLKLSTVIEHEVRSFI